MDRVRVSEGMLKGLSGDGFDVFWGIPYARPPVGELRWRPPQPPEAWEGVYHADRYPGRSMQEIFPMEFYDKEFRDEPERLTPPSEDSLYLNIWTPAAGEGEKLPVAFWIHGGAFMGGFGHEKEFDGGAFCRRGVILVTVNYRLGPFGFLAHPLLSAEDKALGGKGVSGNYGILDQIAALKWVRENIAAFGGDPERITVLGQSAGCMSVQTLVSSPLTRGMIAGAVLQSGVGLSFDRPLAAAERDGTELAANGGAADLEALRAMTPEQIYAAAGPLIGRGFATGELAFVPNIDGHVLERGYDEIVDRGLVHDIPYLVGSTRNDIRVEPEMLAAGDRGPVYAGCIRWCEARREQGGQPAWLYYFTRALPGDEAGAFHSSELWYMFGTLNSCWRPFTAGDRALSEQMVGYWTNFIKTGDPNGEGLPRWEPCTGENSIRVLDVEEK